MALIQCPECGKHVSETAYKCPSCAYVINKPQRGVIGKIFKALFILFNGAMLLCFLYFAVTVWMIGSADGASPEFTNFFGVIGGGVLFYIWALIGLPLALMNYLTRPKAYEE